MSKLLVADSDVHKFPRAHPKELHLFESFLEGEGVNCPRYSPTSSHSSDSLNKELDPYASPSEQEPHLKHHHEAPTIQLFYDLFFVANLTTFTTVHEVNDPTTLKSYIGFFGILWFTWLQVTLYDVRFSADSYFERVCKALHFGVMAGFAVVGPGYKINWEGDTDETRNALRAFKTLSLILMASRVILVCQYSVALYYLRGFKKAYLPIILHIFIILVAGIIFLGMFFYFSINHGDKAAVAWYVTIGVEATIVLLVSGVYKFLSFRKTHMVERLGLLTLIILGEGIIGLCGSIQKVQRDGNFGADLVGMIICGVVIIYCLYMLYFDQTETEKVGTFRQQLWILSHFPYHVSILLVVEGASQLCTWRKLIDHFNLLTENSRHIPDGIGAQAIVDYIKTFTDDFFSKFDGGPTHIKVEKPDLDEFFDTIRTSNDTNAVVEAIGKIYVSVFNFAADAFGIEPPEGAKQAQTEEATLDGLFSTFTTVFIYFFLTAGLAIILTAFLFLIGKRHKIRADFLIIVCRMLLGLGLSLLIIMALAPDNSKAASDGQNFALSAWMLPTCALTYLLIVAIDNLIVAAVSRLLEKKRNGSGRV